MPNLLDKQFRYTPVRDMDPQYLRRKFEEIRAQQAAQKTNVASIKRKGIK